MFFNNLSKFLQRSALAVALAFIVPIGIANDAGTEEDDEECCDSIEEDREDTLVKIAEQAAEFMGLDEEETAVLIEDAMSEYNKVFDNPEAAFEQQLKKLESFIPELSGISSIWETKEKITLFSELTIPIARHYQSNDKQIKRLQTTTKRLIDTAPETPLSGAMEVYTTLLVTHIPSIQEDVSMFEQEAIEIQAMKKQLLDQYPETDFSFADDFLTCVDSLRQKANKEVTKMFSNLANKMDQAARSIEKMQHTNQDFLIETVTTISNVFTPYTLKLGDLRGRVFSKNCYDKIDFELLEQIAADLGEDS